MFIVQEKRIIFGDVIKSGIRLGVKNIVPLILTVLLYVLTCWIPYLNIGTTIGLYKIIMNLGRGEKIDPVSIFDKSNFKPFGNFFILIGLESVGYTAALACMIIPAIVLEIAWSFAIFVLIEHDVTATKALSLSYNITLGEKWKLFFIGLFLTIVISLICVLLAMIPKVGIILSIIAAIFGLAISAAVEGVIYKKLSSKIMNLEN